MFKFALKNIVTGKYVTKYTTEDGAGAIYVVLGYDDNEVYLESSREFMELITKGEDVGSYYREIDDIIKDYKDLRIIPIPFP